MRLGAMGIDARVFIEPQQGASYADQLRVVQAAEQIGFSAFFRSDHYLSMNCAGLPGPTDAWITLGALARETSTIRLGTLVTSNTFRSPGQLGIIVSQVDQMSSGRIDFGLGAGWYQAEHEAYAIDFPPTAKRFDRFAESLEILTGMWQTPAGQLYNFTGKYYSLHDCPALPKPYQSPHPPIIIGGIGKVRTPVLAAQYADEFNIPFHSAEESKQVLDRVAQACHDRGREILPIWSCALFVCMGKTDAEVQQRADKLGRDLSEVRHSSLTGSIEEVRNTLGRYRDQGITRIYGQFLDLQDLDQLALLYEAAQGI